MDIDGGYLGPVIHSAGPQFTTPAVDPALTRAKSAAGKHLIQPIRPLGENSALVECEITRFFSSIHEVTRRNTKK
jgi:hypothetical protein